MNYSGVGVVAVGLVAGYFSVPGCLLIGIKVGQEPTVLAVGACEDWMDFFSLDNNFSFHSLSLGEGSIWTEILSESAVKSKSANQPQFRL